MAKKLKKWTENEVDVLRTMYHAGATYPEIAKMLKRSAGACQQRAHHEGITKSRTNKQYVSDTLTTQVVEEYTNEISSDVEPTTWIGRIKRLLGIGG